MGTRSITDAADAEGQRRSPQPTRCLKHPQRLAVSVASAHWIRHSGQGVLVHHVALTRVAYPATVSSLNKKALDFLGHLLLLGVSECLIW